MANATIRVATLKVSVPLAAEKLPRDIVPADGPPGEPTLLIELEGTTVAAEARINGRNYRRMLKQVDDQGAGDVVVVLQGVLRPATTAGGPLVLEGAGFQVTVKAPRPSGEASGA